MKATGIVRRVDDLGRIVMPKEIRKVYDINNGEPLEIYVEDDMIVIKKYAPVDPCIITGKVSSENMKIADGKIIISPEGLDILRNEINNI